MRRRDFVKMIGVATAAWPLAIRAERPKPAPLIGVLFPTRADDAWPKTFMPAFAKLVKEHIDIQYRFGAGDTDVTQACARELIGMRPGVILAVSNTSMAALHHEATTIPIVFMAVSDPVGMGYLDSLSRPGGSVTGLTPFEPSLGSKWLSLLKELAPAVEDVGVIFNPEPGNNSGSFLRAIESAAASLAIKKIVTPRGESADIERTIVALGKTPHSGLVFLPDALTFARRNKIVELIAQQRVPAIYPWRDFVTAGGLISYGPDERYGDEMVRQAANYVNRILDGEMPADLPVQAPTKLAIAINARAAKTLGLEMPASLMALAEEVIE